MEDPIEKANHRIAELRKEITAKLRAVKELESKNSTLQSSLDERDKALKALHESAAADEQRRKETDEEKWAEYHGLMARLRDEQKAVDDARLKVEQQRGRQLKEIADSRQLVEQWQAAVDNTRRENEQLKQQNVSQLHDYQQRYIAVQADLAKEKRTFSERLYAAEADLARQTERVKELEDVVERQSLALKSLDSQLLAERQEREAQYRAYRERTSELHRLQEEKVRELTNQYLLLTSESESIVAAIKAEIDFRGDKLHTLAQWELSRERLEDEGATLKSNMAKLRKDWEAEKKERAKAERDVEKEMAALRDSVIVLQSDKELLQKELHTKKAALKVYKDEFEAKQKQRIEAEEKEKAKAAQDRERTTKGGLTGGLMSLFGGKKKDDADLNGAIGGKTPHPSAMHSAADKGFLDLEEEMAVALTERVERLSEEKGKLEDELTIAQRQLEQERIVTANLRQQLKLDGKVDAADPAVKAQSKKDKVVLSPENTTKVLTDTIARNRELEELKKEHEKELKRLKAQLDVKRQELKEALRSGRGGSATPNKSRSNSTMSTGPVGDGRTATGSVTTRNGES